MCENRRKIKLKYFVGVIGVLVTIAGWIIVNATHFSIVYRLFCPNYLNAQAGYERLHEKNVILKEEDIGFKEISGILKEDIIGDIEPIITQIKTLDWGKDLGNTKVGMEWNKYLELEISLANSKPLVGKFRNLDLRMEEKYLNRNLFSWSSKIFWIGIVISTASVFL